MAKVIIGIHGRSNKPEEEQLKTWWKASITEGLAINFNEDFGNADFEMAYYADLCYPNPVLNDEKLRTPSCVTGSWLNFADPQDRVSIDSHLADDYSENSTGVRVKDVFICNDYPDNPHKSYRYLRTPEFSKHLLSFL